MAGLDDKMADFRRHLLGLRMAVGFPFNDFFQFPVEKVLQLAFFKFSRIKGLEVLELLVRLLIFAFHLYDIKG